MRAQIKILSYSTTAAKKNQYTATRESVPTNSEIVYVVDSDIAYLANSDIFR